MAEIRKTSDQGTVEIPPLYGPRMMQGQNCTGVEKVNALSYKVRGEVLPEPRLVLISKPVDPKNPLQETRQRIVGCLYGLEGEKGKKCMASRNPLKRAPCQFSKGESRKDPERHNVTEAHLAKIIDALELACPLLTEDQKLTFATLVGAVMPELKEKIGLIYEARWRGELVTPRDRFLTDDAVYEGYIIMRLLDYEMARTLFKKFPGQNPDIAQDGGMSQRNVERMALFCPPGFILTQEFPWILVEGRPPIPAIVMLRRTR